MSVIRTSARVLVACALLGTSAFASAAHSADERARGWVLTRQGRASIPIEGLLTSQGVSEESAVVMFALAGRGANRGLDGRFGTTRAGWGVDGWAQFRGAGVESPPCPAGCTNPAGVSKNVWISSHGRALSSVVYIAAYDIADPDLSLSSPGWTVKQWRPSLRFLTATGGSSEGVSVAHVNAGHFRGGELAGGPFGSYVSAILPCDNHGIGDGAMSGGWRTWRLSCSGISHTFDWTSRATRWRLDADTIGWSYATAPLFVVDYPRG